MRDGNEYSLREYYGSVGDLYHIYVYDKLFQWHWSHPEAINTYVEVGYDRLKELFVNNNSNFF